MSGKLGDNVRDSSAAVPNQPAADGGVQNLGSAGSRSGRLDAVLGAVRKSAA